MMRYKRSKYLIITINIILLILIIFTILGISFSQRMVENTYSMHKDGLLSPFTIVHISDLHYPKNTVALDKIQSSIQNTKPDFIALTGDTIDGSSSLDDIRFIFDYFNEIALSFTTFYVLGNHEIGHKNLNELTKLLQESHINYLSNELKTMTLNGDKLAIIGISDGKKLNQTNVPTLHAKATCKYSVLLAHRPELFDNYYENSIDLVLSGHTHGGQVRFFGQGLIAPNQGILPKYSHGLYTKDTTSMLVSSGLSGRGRFYNPYEINIIKVS